MIAPAIEFSNHLSEAELVALAEAFGGTRLYIPIRMTPNHRIAKAIGFPAALRLWDGLGVGSVRVPLARDVRLRHYRAQGLSHAKIARRLGVTEMAIGRMVSRLRKAGKLLD